MLFLNVQQYNVKRINDSLLCSMPEMPAPKGPGMGEMSKIWPRGRREFLRILS